MSELSGTTGASTHSNYLSSCVPCLMSGYYCFHLLSMTQTLSKRLLTSSMIILCYSYPHGQIQVSIENILYCLPWIGRLWLQWWPWNHVAACQPMFLLHSFSVMSPMLHAILYFGVSLVLHCKLGFPYCRLKVYGDIQSMGQELRTRHTRTCTMPYGRYCMWKGGQVSTRASSHR